MKKKRHIYVIGGGAAGIIAAISAKRLGADVTILERNPRIGKKILATGNGRCNYTNVNADVSCYYGNNPKFAYNALSGFSSEDAIRFFEKLGIEPKVEDMGKVFPMSEQASSIVDVFLYELNTLSIEVICDAFVKSIAPKNDGYIIKLEDGRTYLGDRVILTPGGKAMPSSGSDGNGYDLAQSLGHTITDIFPALVQLMLEGPFFKRIDGVKVIGTAEILHKNKSIAIDRGDILFANYGVSGPPIFQISRKAGELLQQGKEACLKIALIDTMTKDELKGIIDKRIRLSPEKSVEFSLVGLLNKRLIPVVLIEAGIEDIKRPVSTTSTNERDSIVNILTNWRFNIKGTKSWPSAQVTAGGVNTKEIDQNTMESKLLKGIYFAGEIMDIDGLCGGFNLQWAWSSGYIAGQNSAL